MFNTPCFENPQHLQALEAFYLELPLCTTGFPQGLYCMTLLAMYLVLICCVIAFQASMQVIVLLDDS